MSPEVPFILSSFSTHPETDPDPHHQVEVEMLIKLMTLTSAAKPPEV